MSLFLTFLLVLQLLSLVTMSFIAGAMWEMRTTKKVLDAWEQTIENWKDCLPRPFKEKV